jgi:hypothetical protein
LQCAKPFDSISASTQAAASEDALARTEKDKMLAGELYDASAPEIQADLAATHRWLTRYNAALDMEPSDRRELLVERFAAVGQGAVIRPPFHCDYGFADVRPTGPRPYPPAGGEPKHDATRQRYRLYSAKFHDASR